MRTQEASLVWRYLNGVTCLYKPPNMSVKTVRYTIKKHLSEDLNRMKVRPPTPFVVIGPGENCLAVTDSQHESKQITEEITVIPSYADNVLVTGPRYIPEEIKCLASYSLSHRMSGVLLLGINRGVGAVKKINYHQLVRVFHIGINMGYETDSGWFDQGQSIAKSKFEHVPVNAIERVLSAMQAAYQRRVYEYAGVLPDSQEAYELAKEGLVKPKSRQGAMIYSARILSFKPPAIVIELQTLNESEDFFINIVTEIGRRVRSAASLSFIKCIRTGNFGIEHALTNPEWQLSPILRNFRLCHRLTKENNELFAENLDEITYDSEPIYDQLIQ